MAVLQGISGLAMGDGNSGKIALSINTQVLEILSNDKLSYLTATITNPAQVQNGTVSYYVPEIIGSGDYGNAGEGVQFTEPAAGLVSINIDKRRQNKYEVETFDISRLNESGYILGVVAAGIARAIQADLNAEYLTFIVSQFKQGATLAQAGQILELAEVGKGNPALTPEQSRVDYNRIQLQIAKFQKMFDKRMLGVGVNEIYGVLSVEADIDLRNAFWNQPNTLGNFVIKETLEGVKLGNLNYFVDVMLNNNIAANTSFSDKTLQTTGLIGLIIHREAVGMPINIQQTFQTINPENGNLRFITKYQFGIGILRPKLIYAIKNTGVQIQTVSEAPKQTKGIFSKKAE